jgi:CBS domain-containing protein
MAIYAYRLETYDLDPDAPVDALPKTEVEPVTLDDPAVKAMTDLKRVRAVTINPDNTIEFALQLMKYAGVRLLVVADQGNRLAGLVTARDIMGEKPISIMTRDRVKREEILVSQVMTPRSGLNPFNFRDVEHASVRDVIVKLQQTGRQHSIVVEKKIDEDDYFVRGIFSITQIGRQLGMEISAEGHVQSFAEFEQLIAET